MSQEKNLKLFMVLIGCKPVGRHTEQHDIFFGIGVSLSSLVPAINHFWPEALDQWHIDAWREVSSVDGFSILIEERNRVAKMHETKEDNHLFFINLGGYKEHEFEEFHFKFLCVANNLEKAKVKAKKIGFYKSTGFKGATSHIDDRYGIDIDDAFQIEELLSDNDKENYQVKILADLNLKKDTIHLGYLPIKKLV
jgi:Domain of Unknown Function (DUF1543)